MNKAYINDFAEMQRRVMMHLLRIALNGNRLNVWLNSIDENALATMFKYWFKAEGAREPYSLGNYLSVEVAQVSYFPVISDNNDLILRLRLIGTLLYESSTNTVVEGDILAFASVLCLSLVTVWRRTLLCAVGEIEPSLSVPSVFLHIFSDKSSPSSCYTSKEDSIIEKLHLPLFVKCLAVWRKIDMGDESIFDASKSGILPSNKSNAPLVLTRGTGDIGPRENFGSFDISPIDSNSVPSSTVGALPEWVINPPISATIQFETYGSVSMLIARILISWVRFFLCNVTTC